MANGYLPKGRSHAELMEPLRHAVSRFKEQTLLNLQANAVKQTIYPTEVYPGYAVINEARKAKANGNPDKGWFSTGRGVKSFRGKVVEASDESEVTVRFQFLDYLRYAELGVGAGVEAEDVERSKKAYYTRRYIKRWSRTIGGSQTASHRPFISMELRHLGTRLSNLMQNFFAYEAEFRVLDIFDDMKLPLGPDGE